MQIKTTLNRAQKFKYFIYGAVSWVEGALLLPSAGKPSNDLLMSAGRVYSQPRT